MKPETGRVNTRAPVNAILKHSLLSISGLAYLMPIHNIKNNQQNVQIKRKSIRLF